MRTPVVEVLEVGEEAAEVYAEIMLSLRRAGTQIPTNDVWIAALAACAGAPVLTCDAHFAAIGRISERILS